VVDQQFVLVPEPPVRTVVVVVLQIPLLRRLVRNVGRVVVERAEELSPRLVVVLANRRGVLLFRRRAGVVEDFEAAVGPLVLLVGVVGRPV